MTVYSFIVLCFDSCLIVLRFCVFMFCFFGVINDGWIVGQSKVIMRNKRLRIHQRLAKQKYIVIKNIARRFGSSDAKRNKKPSCR